MHLWSTAPARLRALLTPRATRSTATVWTCLRWATLPSSPPSSHTARADASSLRYVTAAAMACPSRRRCCWRSRTSSVRCVCRFVSSRVASCRLVSCWTLMLCGTAVGCCPYLTLLAILPAAAAYVSVVQPPSMARASATLSDVLSCRNAAGLQPLHVAAWGESAVAALTGSGASSGSGASGGGRASLLRGGVWDGSWATVDIGADDAFDGGVICSPEGDASRRRAAVERQLRRAAAEAQARLDILTYLASLAGASTCLSR
jgi:hypothetical protein